MSTEDKSTENADDAALERLLKAGEAYKARLAVEEEARKSPEQKEWEAARAALDKARTK